MTTLKEQILNSALNIIMQKGLNGWTMGDTATAAEVSKGLIHYHFKSRAEFLKELHGTINLRRANEMMAALTGKSGTAALDQLWQTMEFQVSIGLFGAWIDLSRELRIVDHELPLWYSKLTREVSKALKIEETILRRAAGFIAPAIDGFQLQLLMGSPKSAVRDGFDRMWAASLAW